MITKNATKKNQRKLLLINGYYECFNPTHKMANKKGYVRYHRMLAYDSGLFTDKNLVVHHKNGNKTDNRLENLEILTIREHTRLHTKKPGVSLGHKEQQEVCNKGWFKPGLNSHYSSDEEKIWTNKFISKLKESDVIRIRELVDNGAYYSELAKIYKVSTATIYQISKRKTWKHI